MRRLALLGAAKGPWVDISRVRRPALKVTGLPEKDYILVKLQLADRSVIEVSFRGCKEHSLLDLGPIGWLSVNTEKPIRDLICEVIEQVA